MRPAIPSQFPGISPRKCARRVQAVQILPHGWMQTKSHQRGLPICTAKPHPRRLQKLQWTSRTRRLGYPVERPRRSYRERGGGCSVRSHLKRLTDVLCACEGRRGKWVWRPQDAVGSYGALDAAGHYCMAHGAGQIPNETRLSCWALMTDLAQSSSCVPVSAAGKRSLQPQSSSPRGRRRVTLFTSFIAAECALRSSVRHCSCFLMSILWSVSYFCTKKSCSKAPRCGMRC